MSAITGNVAAHIAALTASTVQTFVLDTAHGCVTVTVRGTVTADDDVFFTVAEEGGTPAVPTVNGEDCYVVAAVAGASKTVFAGDGPVEVSVISGGTPGISVEGGLPALVREL
jgi:hypothetical protein